jgi:molybdopterin molybdotransferase
MIKIEKALKIILDNVKIIGSEPVGLSSSFNRVLAEDIYSKENIPPFDNSAMDGYALRASDILGASPNGPAVLDVVEDIKAGDWSGRTLKRGEAVRIMTGAPIPRGADCVVMVEETERFGEKVLIFKQFKRGNDIRCAGEDVRRGEKVLNEGSLIRPQEMGMLAALGHDRVKVFKRPKVGILATGSELVDVSKNLAKGKIRNSNSFSLFGQVLKAGAIPFDLGIVSDDLNEIKKRIKSGLKYDVLLTSGGVSVGDYDFVKDVLRQLGASMKFWKVAIKPGKPLAFGKIAGKPVFGLPGNPVSSMVVFEEFVRPAMLKMSGMKKLRKPRIVATLTEGIKKKPGRRHFIRGEMRVRGGRYYVKSTGPQSSGVLKSMTRANSFIILDERKRGARRGERVSVEAINQTEIE